eukprot:Skav205697  [mRNA]  locus=scaffold3495:81761:86552:+ [translate_table: standard]
MAFRVSGLTMAFRSVCSSSWVMPSMVATRSFWIKRLDSRRANCGIWAIFFAASTALGSTSLVGTTSLQSPHSRASAAVNSLPYCINCFARVRPTIRGSSTEEPSSGTRPSSPKG